MIAATPVFGGHYFVDLVAGAALAAAVVATFAALPAHRGLFQPPGTPSTAAPAGQSGRA